MNVKDKQQSSPSILRQSAGYAAGTSVLAIPFAIKIRNLAQPMTDEQISKIKKKLDKHFIELDSFEKVEDIAKDIIKKTGLEAKGTKLDITKTKPPKDSSELQQKQPKGFWQKFKFNIKERKQKTFDNGLNACFNFKKNNIVINDKSLYSAVFHEIGHALNFHSKITKPLSALRIFTQLTTIIPVAPLAILGLGMAGRNKKNEQDNNQNKRSILNFVHDNAGKLMLSWWAPVVAEEALASARGIKEANKYLTKAQTKTHMKNLLYALSTYVLSGVVISALVTAGVWVNDKIVNDKSKKINNPKV